MISQASKQASKRKLRAIPSPVTWFGGKGQQWHWIVKHFPEHTTYVEPFGGGASVLLNKPPVKVEVYNDLDSRLIDLFSVLRNPQQSEALSEQLALTPFSELEYYRACDEPMPIEPIERARRTFVMFRFCFGGTGTRGTKTGFSYGKVQSNATKTRNAIDALPTVIDRLRNVQIMSRDAVDVIRTFDTENTLHYCDPPYALSARSKSNDYMHDMTDADQERIAETLNSVKGKAVVSGYPSPLYERLYAGWRTVERTVGLSCARHLPNKPRQQRTELLWMNF